MLDMYYPTVLPTTRRASRANPNILPTYPQSTGVLPTYEKSGLTGPAMTVAKAGPTTRPAARRNLMASAPGMSRNRIVADVIARGPYGIRPGARARNFSADPNALADLDPTYAGSARNLSSPRPSVMPTYEQDDGFDINPGYDQPPIQNTRPARGNAANPQAQPVRVRRVAAGDIDPTYGPPPTSPQVRAITHAANSAHDIARDLRATPLPAAGPLPTGGRASVTLPDGRTVTRDYGTANRYTQTVSGDDAGLPALPAPLMASSGARPAGYTADDVARIDNDRQRRAAHLDDRGDELSDMLAYPGAAADARDRQQARGVAIDQARAGIAKTDAETGAITAGAAAGVSRVGDLEKQLKDVTGRHDKLFKENEQLREQLGKASPTTRPSDVVAQDRERRLAGEAWMKTYNQLKNDPEFLDMPMRDRIAMAKEISAIDAEQGAGGGQSDAAPIPARVPSAGRAPTTQGSGQSDGESISLSKENLAALSQLGLTPSADGRSAAGGNGESYALTIEGGRVKARQIQRVQ